MTQLTNFNIATIDAIFLDAAGTFLHETGDGIAVFDDARAILQLFRQRQAGNKKIRTGIITNWSERIHTIVERFALQDCFDVIVCASDVRHAKPDREIFVYASELIDCPPERCLHIGDSLGDDAIGARLAGLQAFWIARRRVQLEEGSTVAEMMSSVPIFDNLDQAAQVLSKAP